MGVSQDAKRERERGGEVSSLNLFSRKQNSFLTVDAILYLKEIGWLGRQAGTQAWVPNWILKMGLKTDFEPRLFSKQNLVNSEQN